LTCGFGSYFCRFLVLTLGTTILSAGISIVGGKEPLYAAVDSANKALKRAKSYPSSRRPTKNAIHFMEKTYLWQDFDEVQKWRNELEKLIDADAPKALLMTLLQIYTQYQDDRKAQEQSVSGYATRAKYGNYDGNSIYLGPWLWQMVYRISRLADSTLPQDKVREIQEALLESHRENRSSGVEKLALSARWVQLLSRKE
jgi:hypothetical protein